jgi:hypothetical protein
MDEAGFVPITLLCGYYSVAVCNAPYEDIILRLVEACEKNELEIDVANETVRLKSGWENVFLLLFFLLLFLFFIYFFLNLILNILYF